MSEITVVSRSADETRAIGAALGALLAAGDVVLLSGGLGAGKTELTKGIGAALGVEELVVSPTFTIARRYPGRAALVHVDLYRLDRVQELFDLGLEEEGEDAVTVIEWGDVATAHLPGDRLEVRLEATDAAAASEDERLLTFTWQGSSWSARASELESAVRRDGRSD